MIENVASFQFSIPFHFLHVSWSRMKSNGKSSKMRKSVSSLVCDPNCSLNAIASFSTLLLPFATLILTIFFNEEKGDDEVYGIEEEDEKQRPFEDCPMPILKCAVHTPSEKLEMKMLIDSGSSLDLISETMARKLQRKGCVTKAMKKIVRIKVANGRRSVLKDAMALRLQFGSQTNEETDFLILEDLPFDFILDYETCRK